MKNVLLTGASGFLGKYILEYLTELKFNTDTIGRGKSADIILDLSQNVPAINKKYDLVVHCAGKAHIIPKTKEEEAEFYEVNVNGTKNLCKGLKISLPNTFVFISTIAVYGRDYGENITESEPLDGSTAYAKSKILAENMLEAWCKKNAVNLVVLRLPLVAGKESKGNFSDMIESIKKGYYFNITSNYARKSIVLASDVARLIPKLEFKNGTYNLAGEKDYTFEEVSTIIAKQLNIKRIKKLPLNMVKIAANLGDVFSFLPINNKKLRKITSSLTISAEKAKRALNWSASSLEDGFKI